MSEQSELLMKAKTEPNTDKQISIIYETEDYNRFKFLKANREPDAAHIDALKRSFEKAYLVAPVVINEAGFIIDGQHRFHAAKQLGLPIRYIICEGYGLEAIKLMNTTSTKWQYIDYLKSYCAQEKEEYLKIRDFWNENKDLKITTILNILTLSSVSDKGKSTAKAGDFKNGNYKIPNLQLSITILQDLRRIEKYFPNWKNNIFIRLFVNLHQKESFDYERLLTNMEKQEYVLKQQANNDDYYNELEAIYNFKSKAPISLKYMK